MSSSFFEARSATDLQLTNLARLTGGEPQGHAFLCLATLGLQARAAMPRSSMTLGI